MNMRQNSDEERKCENTNPTQKFKKNGTIELPVNAELLMSL